MKVVNLSPDDPDIFLIQPTFVKCNFVTSNFEAFMQMYKTQGSTFWLRFLVSFKIHTEDKLCKSKKWMSVLMQHFQFIKVMNYIYINIHKRFIEGSNTSVKKFINNLLTLTLNSPTYLNLNCEQWLAYIKTSKQLHTTFQNLFGETEAHEYSGFTALVFTIYTDFYCALCAVFEQWYSTDDLTEDDIRKIDSKIIYWMPPYNREKVKPLCFEKYLSNYWKKDLQRMLLTDNIHNLFDAHKTNACCDAFDKEKNLFKLFHFTDKTMMDFMKIIYSAEDSEGNNEGKHTITEACIQDVCMLKPQVMLCTEHQNCFVKICHVEKCLEPYICKGESPCVLSCETKIKNEKKQKQTKFWKTVSVEVFPIDKKKCDASTLAESYDRDIQTYLHVRKSSSEFDMSLAMFRSTYQCFAELHNFDFNPRKTECLNRLRKKLSQKNPSAVPQFNPSSLKDPLFRENLLKNAMMKMIKIEQQYCFSKDHNLLECDNHCFDREIRSVAISSSNAFGRVIFLSTITISVPSDMTHECKHHTNNSDEKDDSLTKKAADSPLKKTDTKKNKKTTKDAIKNKNPNENSSVNKGNKANKNIEVSEPAISEGFTAGNLKEVIENSVIEEDESSEIKIDDDIDELCRLIGIADGFDDMGASNNKDFDQGDFSSSNSIKPSSNEDLDNFFKLIGAKSNDHVTKKSVPRDSEAKNLNDVKLRICAYCKKKEARRKMFKKCCMCKEDNFPVHRYYCSQECFMEDWSESHEDEHLRFKKQLSFIKNK